MPKEITHWIIADRVSRELPEGPLATAVRQNPNCLHLGAVFHDAGYYATGSDTALLAFADRLHGAQGEDTNEILEQLSPVLSRIAEKPCLNAFLVGLVTHIVADRYLHPLVYYFTGNYYDRSVGKQARAAEAHRRLEVLIDLYVAGGLARVSGYSLRNILGGLETSLSSILEETAHHLGSDGDGFEPAEMTRALRRFSRVQGAIRRPGLIKAARGVSRLLGGKLDGYLALAYFPELESLTQRLAGSLAYRNPFTGDAQTARLDQMIPKIVDTCVDLCGDLPASLAGWGRGESLEMGIVSAPAADARFFHPYVVGGEHARIARFETLIQLP